MAKFRKKPVVVEAVQVPTVLAAIANEDLGVLPEWMIDALREGRLRVTSTGGMEVKTLESSTDGRMLADFGDWIIRGVQGELYPCKPGIFEAIYEAL